METRTALTLAAALVAFPVTAAAASGDRPDFKKADANGDGKVAVSEATQAGVPKSEAKNEDIDGDGKLTKADWKFVDMKSDSGSDSGSGSS